MLHQPGFQMVRYNIRLLSTELSQKSSCSTADNSSLTSVTHPLFTKMIQVGRAQNKETTETWGYSVKLSHHQNGQVRSNLWFEVHGMFRLMQDPQLTTEQSWMAATNPNIQQPNPSKTARLEEWIEVATKSVSWEGKLCGPSSACKVDRSL